MITDKIATKSDTDQTIFNMAQCEVEERMTRTTYRNFLASDMHLAYIQTAKMASKRGSLWPLETRGRVRMTADTSPSSLPPASVTSKGRGRVRARG